ncbi:MAG: hypothetical protein ACOCSR_01555, partial [Wenzhouxiangella sp.]
MNENDTRTSEKQKLRLRRLHLAMVAWTVSIILTAFAWSLGLLDMSAFKLALLVLIVLTIHLIFHIVIRSGWNLKFRDPSLTLAQILAATLVGLWVISHADEARTILLMLFIIAIFFGVFQLRTKEFLLVTVVAVSGYGLIVFNDFLTGASSRTGELILLELGGFATVMIWLSFVGSHVAELRRKLGERNRELKAASEHLGHLADHDELTGLPNRRRLLAQLKL